MRYTWKTYAIKLFFSSFASLKKLTLVEFWRLDLSSLSLFSSFYPFLFSHSFLSSFLLSFLFNFICCYCIYVYCVRLCMCPISESEKWRLFTPSWHFKSQSNDPLLWSTVIKSAINKINDPLKILQLWLLVFPFSLPHFLPFKSWCYVS